MPLRIAFLSRLERSFNGHTPYHEPLGGTQCALVFQARALAALGHQVHVFCHGPAAEVDGVRYHALADLPRLAGKLDLDAFIPVADEAALKLRIPARQSIAWLHNDYPFLWHEMPDLRADFAGLLATQADRVVVTCRWQAELVCRTFALPAEHVRIIPLGLNPELFAAEPEPASPLRLFYTSVPNRGLDLLLDYWPRLQSANCELHIYSSFKTWGMSQQKDELAAGSLYARARALPGVYLHEPLSPFELPQQLRTGSLWVFPQHRSRPLPQSPGIWMEAETFCISALEAQAAGMPVVASARGALNETIVDGQTGILIPGNPMSEAFAEAFVAACLRLLADQTLRHRLGQAARQRALGFSWQAAAEQWQTLLEDQQVTRLQQAPLKSDFPRPELSILLNLDEPADDSAPFSPAQLASCLQILSRQDYKAFEVLVCSRNADLCREAKSWREQLNLRCRQLEDEEPLDISLKLARGKLLLLLAPPAELRPQTLTKHLQAHAQGAEVVSSSEQLSKQTAKQTLCLSIMRPSFLKLALSKLDYASLLQDILNSELNILPLAYD